MFHLSTFVLSFSVLPGLISAAIDPNEFNTISLHQQFAAAAYCPDNSLPPGPSTARISCRTNNCPDVQNANQNIIRKFALTPIYNTTGYVAVDRTHQLIVVAFRGTEDCDITGLTTAVGNCRAAVDSLVTTAVPQFCLGCEIGSGWLGAWNEVRDDVLEEVRAARITNPGFRVLTTGHSLGGALATVAGIELRSKGYTVDLTPFASPRIINSALARFVGSQDNNVTPNISRNRRVTHTGDGVNNLPTAIRQLFPGLPDYFHFEPSFFIKSGNGPAPVTFADIDIVPGIDAMVPMAPVLTPAGLPDIVGITATAIAHSFYLNPISQCFAFGPATPNRLVTEQTFPIRAILPPKRI